MANQIRRRRKSRKIKLNEPWTCECGKQYEIGGWAAAHWHEILIHTCDCGRKHELHNGVLTYIGVIETV
jgi:hypothetical protein